MKVFEIIEQPGETEWENHHFQLPRVITDTPDERKHLWKEKDRKNISIRHQDDIIANRYIALEDKYPNEIKSRGVPDDNDSTSDYMPVPPEVEADPEAWTTIECNGRWLYDMQQNDACDPHEEFYILKSSPRHQLVVRIIERHKQLMRLRHRPWPPMVIQK